LCVGTDVVLKELDGKIGHLVIELQKKKRALEQEHTETQMVQVRGCLHWAVGVTRVTGLRGHWLQGSLGLKFKAGMGLLKLANVYACE